ncbi:MAG: hypothetical protein JXA54_01275 [Candidatus Heimdallarchaeota archaeon]|nr:hypothetical protein [Candidatus Heimdallarchaeota archaeon]
MSNNAIDQLSNQTSDTKKNISATKSDKRNVIIAIVILIAILIGLVFGAIVLFKQDADTTARIRDLFIIFMALEMLLVGIAVIVLVIQIAQLTNLLQNEVKPILSSTTDTVNTLKGTVRFLSDNLVGPVIKVNSTVAGGKKLLDLFRFKK